MITVNVEYQTTDTRARLTIDVSDYDGCDLEFFVYDELNPLLPVFPNSGLPPAWYNGTFIFDVWGLNPNTEYTFNIQGTDSFDGVWKFLTQPPIHLIAPAIDQANINLSPFFNWDDTGVYDYFEFILRNDETSDTIASYPAVHPSIQIIDLSYGTTYKWRVRGKNAAGYSEWAPFRFFTTMAERLPVEYALTVGGVIKPIGGLVVAATIREIMNYLVTVSGRITPVGGLTRGMNVRELIHYALTVKGTIKPIGGLTRVFTIRQVVQYLLTVSGRIAPSGGLQAAKNFRQVVQYALTVRGIIKPIGGISAVKTLREIMHYTHTIARTFIMRGDLQRTKNWRQVVEYAITLKGTLKMQGAVSMQKFNSTFVGYEKKIQRTLIMSGSIRREAGKTIRHILPLVGRLFTGRYEHLIQRTLIMRGGLTKQADKKLQSVLRFIGRLRRKRDIDPYEHYYVTVGGYLLLTGSLSRSASYYKKMKSKIRLIGKLNPNGALITKRVQGTLPMHGGIRRAATRTVQGIIVPISHLVKAATNTVGGVLVMRGAPLRRAAMSMTVRGTIVMRGQLQTFWNLVRRYVTIQVERTSKVVLKLEKPYRRFIFHLRRQARIILHLHVDP